MIVANLGREFVPNGWDDYSLITFGAQELLECRTAKLGTQHYIDEWLQRWREEQTEWHGMACVSAHAMPHPSRAGTFIVLAEVRARR